MSEANPELDVVDLLNFVMDTVVSTFNQYSVALPERQFIQIGAAGETPHDCEQVSVTVDQLYSGPPGEQAQIPAKCDEPRTAVIVVEVVRCSAIPPRGVPTVEALNEDAVIKAVDGWTLLEAGLRVGDNYLGSLADVTFSPMSGSYQATVLTLTTAIGSS